MGVSEIRGTIFFLGGSFNKGTIRVPLKGSIKGLRFRVSEN